MLTALHFVLWSAGILLALVALTYLVEALYWLVDLAVTGLVYLLGATAFLVKCLREGMKAAGLWCWRKARAAWRR